MGGKRTRSELETTLKAAEEALRVRDEFLRLAGHELRSPLTAVQLQTDALTMIAGGGGSAGEIDEWAERVKRSVSRLAWVIDEVVDVGRASGGRLALHLGRTDLVLLAQRVLERFADELRRAGCEVNLAATGPVFGSWDAQRLEHAIGSLLLTALKTGSGPRIDMEVSADGGDGEGSARLSLRGRGEGLSAEECARVFVRLEQLLVGLQAGSPLLGLWLARAVAEAHGGCLVLEPGVAALELPKRTAPAGSPGDGPVRGARRRPSGARSGRRGRAP